MITHFIRSLSLVLLFLLLGCAQVAPTAVPTDPTTAVPPTPVATPTPIVAQVLPTPLPAVGGEVRGSAAAAAIEQATRALIALRDQDMATLADMAHADGIRFAPYSGLRDDDLIFSAAQIADLYEDEAVYTWGISTGIGEPIEATYADYADRYAYGVDYLAAEIVGYNERISYGNQINNIPDIYPDTEVIEYHFTGFDEQYNGLDWRSLFIVLIETEDGWKIAAVINDEWTI